MKNFKNKIILSTLVLGSILTIGSVSFADELTFNIVDTEQKAVENSTWELIKDGKVIDSIEVTSKTADKSEQSSKEERIRDNGGNYIRDNNGNLVEIPSTVHTHIERRD